MQILWKFGKQLSVYVLVLVTTSCSVPNSIRYQYDHAAEIKNYRWEHRAGDMKLRSPLVYIDQTFLKQRYSDQSVLYKLYDVVVLHENEFRLDDRVYLLVDNLPITLIPQNREDDNWRTKDTKRDEVLLADSTKLSVVTG